METHIVKKKLSAAYRYSYTHLALNYYSYFEAEADGNLGVPELAEYRTGLEKVLSAYLAKEDCTDRVKKLREKITASMDFVINYAECFQIYEYVFNRMERRFYPQKDELPEDGALIEQLAEFFSSSADNMILNDRIKEIMAEVPIRFTKAKFFSLVTEALAAYAGSSKQTFEEYLKLLHTFTVLQGPKNSQCGYEKLTQSLVELSKLDYKNLEKEQFAASLTSITEAGEQLAACVDRLLLAQQLTNDLYIMCLSKEDAVIELNEENAAEQVVRSLLQLQEAGETQIPESVGISLMALEGRQESSYERYAALIQGDDDGTMDESEMVHRLLIVDRLMSNSPFMELEPDAEVEEIADEAWVMRRADTFCEELSEVFAELPKPVVRAIMAKILSSLPLWFRSMDEIIEYVQEGLASCLDIAEKESSVELICKIMEMEYALV